jgi:hypothetical protein
MPEAPKVSYRYSVVVKRHERNPTWAWRILRTPEPLGVNLYGDNFQSEHAARETGERALRSLLDGLAKDARSPLPNIRGPPNSASRDD